MLGLLKDIAREPDADLIAIADPHPEPSEQSQSSSSATVKLYSDYVRMLAKPCRKRRL